MTDRTDKPSPRAGESHIGLAIALAQSIGTERTADEGSTIQRSSEDAAWIVTSGTISSVLRSDGGARVYAVREAGDLIIAPPSDDGPARVELLVGYDTKLVPLAQDQVGVFFDHPIAIRALDRWIRSTTSVLAPLADRQVLDLQSKGEVTLQDQEARSATSGPTWITLTSGSVTVQADGAQESRTLGTQDDPFLMPFGASVTATGEATLTCRSAADTIQQQDTSTTLAALGTWAMHALGMRLAHDRQEVAHAQIQEETLASSDEQMTRRNIASIEHIRSSVVIEDPRTQQPLMDAAHRVSMASGVRCRVAELQRVPEGVAAGVDAFARVNHCQFRRVTLSKNWERSQSGPLLTVTADGDPVALLPRRGSRYSAVVYLPDEIRRIRTVTAAFGKTLEPSAFMFFAPLPDESIGLKGLIKYILPALKSDIVWAISFSLVIALMNMAMPIALAFLKDDLIVNDERQGLFYLGLGLAAIAAGAVGTRIVQHLAILRMETRMSYGLLASLVDRLVRLPSAFFRRYDAGDLAQRIGAMEQIRAAITSATITTLSTFVFSFVYIGFLFYYNTWIAILTIIAVIMLIGLDWIGTWIDVICQKHIQTLQGRITSWMLQLINGVGRLRIAHAEKRGLNQWMRPFQKHAIWMYREGVASNIRGVFTAGILLLLLVSVYAVFYYLYQESQLLRQLSPAMSAIEDVTPLTIGQFLAINATLGMAVTSSRALGTTLAPLARVKPAYDRIKPIIQTMPEVNAAAAAPGPLSGSLELSNVTFTYPDAQRPTLLDVSLKVDQGAFVAITGPTGCGKSTILRLMLGLDQPDSGDVLYGQSSLRELDVAMVRRQCGVVLQDGKLLPGDIKTNIIGASGLPLDVAWKAAEIAGFADDVHRMPMGMFTMVNEHSLSGAQRQKLLIARSVVGNPKILFMDEATSSLDNQSQAEVTAAVDALDVTRVVIAHRLSTIKAADRIYVVEAGRIVQSGSFSELIGQPGLFSKLVDTQVQ